MTDFSISVAVGQAWTQAPHETHSEPRKLSSIPGDTLEAKPRPSIVSAKVPCTSSQARTQREPTMHVEAGKDRSAWSTTGGHSSSASSANQNAALQSRQHAAMTWSSQLQLADQVRQSSAWSEI